MYISVIQNIFSVMYVLSKIMFHKFTFCNLKVKIEKYVKIFSKVRDIKNKNELF